MSSARRTRRQTTVPLDLGLPHVIEARKLTAAERRILCDVLLQGQDLEWAAAKALLGFPSSVVFSREPLKKGKGKLAVIKGSATAQLLHDTLKEEWEELSYEERVELVGDLVSTTKDRSVS